MPGPINWTTQVGSELGGFTVGHCAKMNGNPAVARISGVREQAGQVRVLLEFKAPQPVDVPEGATSTRFDLDWRCISSTWRPAT